jgi:tRNA (Thr-GGU) A37 N-methylase
MGNVQSVKQGLMSSDYLDEQLRGVFGTRAPERPNPIGMAKVRLAKVKRENLPVQRKRKEPGIHFMVMQVLILLRI